MQFIDLQAQYAALKKEISQNIEHVLENAQYIGGIQVEELERRLAEYVGRAHCITCGNGTDALQLAYMMLGVGKGDAIFCPDMTFIASVEPALMLGATPVFCDIKADTYTICPDSLERQIKAVLDEGKLTPKVVVAVDILGNPCEYDALEIICRKYNLTLVEDAAQGFGASYHGRRAGSFGTISTTSFFPAKPLGCYGDGGAVFVDDEDLAQLCRSLCVHGKGSKGKYDNVRVGMNSRLDTIQAAILLVKLKAFEDYELEFRQGIAKRYNEAFSELFQIPYVESGCISAWAQYTLLAKNKEQRDNIVEHLTNQGIPNMIYYPTPQHELPVFATLNIYGEKFKNARDYCARTFSLPMHPYLQADQQEKIVSCVKEKM